MARARTIKPHFMRSRSMRAVGGMARLTFIELWLVADDAGRLVAHPLALARRLYPGDDEAAGLLPGWLADLEREHCIERYTVEGTDYLRIVNWRRHQRIYHPTPSRLPARPVGAEPIGVQPVLSESGELPEGLGSDGGKPSSDRELAVAAEIPERFTTPPETLGKNPGKPCTPGSSPAFTSDSGGGGIFRRVAAAAQRALVRQRALARVG